MCLLIKFEKKIKGICKTFEGLQENYIYLFNLFLVPFKMFILMTVGIY